MKIRHSIAFDKERISGTFITFLKQYRCIKTILILICAAMAIGCSNPTPRNESDDTEHFLDETINSIKSGLPYATQRVEEWRDTMHLNFINASFVGKEQIEERMGMISYFFYEEKATDKLDADATVRIDMNKNSIVYFSSSYGTPKKLGGSANVLNTESWTIDINEVFDIAIAELGEDSISQYDNTKIVLTCSETFWEFAVYSYPDARYPDITVKIDPVKGEVMDIRDNKQSED